jgi:hypothetical protein
MAAPLFLWRRHDAYNGAVTAFQDPTFVTPYDIQLIDTEEALNQLAPRLSAASVFALDIETVNWWNRDEERISIIQIGFREESQITVAIFDTLAAAPPEPLRRQLEMGLQIKAIHNAGFDAVKLERHYGIRTSPVHDTMLAARRSGEKGCSLKDLVDRHLGIALDKTEQRGDWSVRPLRPEQLRYAALDVVFTLLIYELQVARGQYGDYQLKTQAPTRQPLSAKSPPSAPSRLAPADDGLAGAILSIVSQMSGRYSRQQLAVTIGSERAGLVGWILDQTIGPDQSPDQVTIVSQIESLLQQRKIKINEDGRLELELEPT